MKSMFRSSCVVGIALLLALAASRAALAALSSPIIVNLPTQDLVYSPLGNRIYATVPNSSAVSPNTLAEIDPTNGVLRSSIPIGFDPTQLVISSNGQTIHALFGGNRGIQPFDVATRTLGTAFFIPGGPQVREMYSIPGREKALLIATHDPRYSPSATGTQVWENGVELRDHVGQGVGSGGPDIVAVDPTNGTRGYGYLPSLSSYDHWSLTIDANGVHENARPPLYGVMTGGVGHIDLLGNRLFNSRGEVYNISPAFQTGSFLGGENFVMDLGLNRLFSITSSNSNHTIRSYDLSTLQLLVTETLSGIPGTASNLTRFGGSGLAFRTSNNQVVLVRASFVPEPSSAFLLMGAAVSGMLLRRRR
ncbi:MAG TPA: PEP-CTERM sorting domain-containing protein [Lacipirellulaceae bacterium]|jgi:hypothetical protein|nr:PEP-CTERM sorting domain-containing protein [Lacipirellulaceae bacterium]